MNQIPKVSLDNLARKVGARMLVVISMTPEGCAVASTGLRAAEKEDAARLAERIAPMLRDGTLANFPAAELAPTIPPKARPPRKTCSETGCSRTAGPGGLCEPHRVEARAAAYGHGGGSS